MCDFPEDFQEGSTETLETIETSLESPNGIGQLSSFHSLFSLHKNSSSGGFNWLLFSVIMVPTVMLTLFFISTCIISRITYADYQRSWSKRNNEWTVKE